MRGIAVVVEGAEDCTMDVTVGYGLSTCFLGNALFSSNDYEGMVMIGLMVQDTSFCYRYGLCSLLCRHLQRCLTNAHRG